MKRLSVLHKKAVWKLKSRGKRSKGNPKCLKNKICIFRKHNAFSLKSSSGATKKQPKYTVAIRTCNIKQLKKALKSQDNSKTF